MTKKKKPKAKAQPESKVLGELGLTREEVRSAFSVPVPEAEKPKTKGYLFLNEQRKMKRRMKSYSNMIFARFEAGVSPTIIAGVLGVSEETVRVRLRRNGYFSLPRD
jgi:DNA-directed RNA polymerase specialized sigma24 family protein